MVVRAPSALFFQFPTGALLVVSVVLGLEIVIVSIVVLVVQFSVFF